MSTVGKSARKKRSDGDVPRDSATTPRSVGVLVVGDWLVDEHWVVGRHRTSLSSRTGRSHARALHTETCSVRSLCGAGQVATILYQAKANGICPFQVNGVGIWHRADKDILSYMLDPNFNVGRTPHRIACEDLKAPSAVSDKSIRLYSLAPPQMGVQAGTTRIIRIYRHKNDKVDLEQRLDWELPLSDIDLRKIRKGIGTSLEKLRESNTPIQHIFIKDLCKGVVSKELINWLRQTFRSAHWYVSSKAWRPTWVEALPKNRVKLFLVPQLPAKKAVRSGEISSPSWLTGGGVPSQDAMRVVDDLTKSFPAAKIIVLPEGMRVLGREHDKCYVLPIEGAADTFPFTPMASVFYPALAAYLIDSRLEFFQALKKAISFTATWEAAEAQRTIKDRWVPTPDQVLLLEGDDEKEAIQPWRTFDWHSLTQQWSEAFSGYGVVTIRDQRKRKMEFQLWRAMTDVGGYVTCIASKRRHVITLLREGRSLKETLPEERRQKSFFVVDVPGSGKSYLVDCLASALGMPCLKFNIASLTTRDDLIECFHNIHLAQDERPDAPFIVFFDEMNGKIGPNHVYDSFLEPLEDGTFVHNGKTYHLSPCLWVFAGTEPPVTSEARNHPSDKAEDFESRLTQLMYLSRYRGSGGSEVREEQKVEKLRTVEQIYIGVATIRQLFPDVTKVSTKVLRAFDLIDPEEVGPRGIKRLVQSFQDVQYGRVLGHNLPDNWNTQVKVDSHAFEQWTKLEDSERMLVEIRSQADG